MTDIFISYARNDLEKVGDLARALEARGLSVWWDRALVGGDEFSSEIETQIDAAGAVIVCWSSAGSKSRWVRDEASMAADGNKLICVSLDGRNAPIGFRQYHCLDLSSWTGQVDDPAFAELERACQARLQGEAPTAPRVVEESRGKAGRSRSTLAIAGLILVMLAAAGWWLNRPAETPVTVAAEPVSAPAAIRRYGIVLPEHAPVDFVGSSPLRTPMRALAITPDGNRLVYTGPSATEKSQLFVRDLDDFEVRALPGTGGAYQPFISPDGRQVAFFAHDELRIAMLDGAAVRSVLAAPNPRGGAWWGNDRIIYSDREGANTWWVSINSNTPQPLQLAQETMPDGRPIGLNDILTPMPDRKRFLVVAFPGIESFGRLCVLDPDSGQLTTVIDMATFGYAANGALIHVMGNDLLALDFDNESFTVSGPPRLVGNQLRRDGSLPQFVLSDRTLIYATGAPYGQRQVAHVGLDGQISKTGLPDSRFADLAVSPDGSTVAATLITNDMDIWLYDIEGGAPRRFTRGGDNHHPMWSNDGKTIYFMHEASDRPVGIYRKQAASASFDTSLVHEGSHHFNRISAGDLATFVVPGEADGDYAVLDLGSGELTVVANQAGVQEDLGDASPDHRWMALTVDASGRYEVVVIPLFRDGPPVQVSNSGGEEPLWSSDMTALFYRYGTRLFRVAVSGRDDGGLEFSEPEVVVDDPMWVNVGGYSYWPDGTDEGFLILRDNQPTTTRELRVVEGWKNIAP